MKNLIYFHYNKDVIHNAKKLRNDLTEEEKKLWYQFLRSYPLSY
jgi:very-short-patch-repair endonuclease